MGGRTPSDYIPRLSSGANIDADSLDKHLATHLCDAKLLRQDEFELFYDARRRALLDRIGAAMGRAIDDDATRVDDTMESDDDTDDM